MSLVSLGVGGTLLYCWFRDQEILEHSKPTPSSITAINLSKNGPGDNWYVRVSDFSFDKPELITRRGSVQRLECYLIPGQGVSAENNKIKVANTMVSSEDDAKKFLQQNIVEGFAHPPRNSEIEFEVKRRPTADGSHVVVCLGVVFALAGLGGGLLTWNRR
jgi:hypothetical protein